MTTYVDSSALVPVYVPERFSEAARQVVGAARQVPFTQLHDLDVPNAFELLVGRGLISRQECRAVQAQLHQDLEAARLQCGPRLVLLRTAACIDYTEILPDSWLVPLPNDAVVLAREIPREDAASKVRIPRRDGCWKALTERLGASGAIRFLMEYDPGHGDYVAERRELFRDLRLDDTIARARAKSGGGAP